MEGNNIIIDDQEEIKPCCVDDLLEEFWFFGNLLMISPNNNNNPKPLNSSSSSSSFTRCYSDPCPSSYSSSTSNDAVTCHDTSSVPKKDHIDDDDDESSSSSSLPVNVGTVEEEASEKERRVNSVINKGKKAIDNSRRINKLLTRTQTLPSSMRNVELVSDKNNNIIINHEEANNKVSKSDRRSSLSFAADFLPPRHNKGNSRYKPPRNTNMELIIASNTDGSKEMRRRYLNGKTLRRSTSELEIEEVQGFKDLGFTFDNKDLLSPSVFNILPGLQQKKEDEILELEKNNKVRRPYLSEAWMVQSCVPPPPNWALNRSSEDMKAQIKFWARSVASNVRMEC